MNILITGSAGLIGSESVKFYCNKDYHVFGIDNDFRRFFFGDCASTIWNKEILEHKYQNYKHLSIDIRDNKSVETLFKDHKFDLIIHAAGQPSHDWAAKDPITDFTVNANGTLILLENYREYCPKSVFIFTSTNKVYGDLPNFLQLVEKNSRYEVFGNNYYNGIDETMSIDNSMHSLFGASKLSADILTQEYGKYFGLNTGIFRCGCITGPAHSPSQLHGFLAYLVYCIITEQKYTIFGHKGKQVRDNIHSYDLINAFDHFFKNPKKGEVYNMGGSRYSNISIKEAVMEIEMLVGKKANIEYNDEPRKGDHIWYISNVSKFKNHYPDWNYKYDIHQILKELCKCHESKYTK